LSRRSNELGRSEARGWHTPAQIGSARTPVRNAITEAGPQDAEDWPPRTLHRWHRRRDRRPRRVDHLLSVRGAHEQHPDAIPNPGIHRTATATCEASVSYVRWSRTTVGWKYRATSKAGRAAPGPAIFETGSELRVRPRPGLRGQGGWSRDA
jgi:hypothetical protein